MGTVDELSKAIAQSGVRDVVGVPGGGPSLNLIDQLEKCGITFHLTHTEAAASIIAGVWGKLSGEPGVCITIKGPGLINSVPGMALAHFEDFPLVAITEAFSTNDSPIKAHKRIDHHLLTHAFSKANCFLANEDTTFGSVSTIAKSESPGPVVLNLSSGMESLNCHPTLVGDSDGATTLSACARPVVIAGSLAVRQGFDNILQQLRIPIFTTVAAKGIVDETQPNAAGIYTGAGKDLALESVVLPKADLVLCVGLRAKEVLAVNKFTCKSVNIDIFDLQVEAEGFGFSEVVNMDRGRELLSELRAKSWGSDLIESANDALLNDGLTNDLFLPPRVFQEIPRIVKDRYRIVVDTGDFNTIAEHFIKAKRINDYLSTPNSRYMGTAIPVGIGSSMHDRQLPHIIVVGDGGIGAYVSELKIAVAQKLPILLMLFSDGGFGSIRTRAKKMNLTQKPLTIANPGWAKIISGFGIASSTISSLNDFDSHLRRWNHSDGPSFMELRFKPEEYESMTKRLR